MAVTAISYLSDDRSEKAGAQSTTGTTAFSLCVETKILLLIFALLGVWGLAIFSFGFPALILPMKVIVPGMFVMLVLLTWGK